MLDMAADCSTSRALLDIEEATPGRALARCRTSLLRSSRPKVVELDTGNEDNRGERAARSGGADFRSATAGKTMYGGLKRMYPASLRSEP
jgi:hypothetical protein